MKSHSLHAAYHEILRSDEWWEFENLARISIFDPRPAHAVHEIQRKLTELDCTFAVREALQERPFCKCSFGISGERQWEKLPELLSGAIRRAVETYREELFTRQKTITPLLEKIERESADKEATAAAIALVDLMRKGDQVTSFSLVQLQVLQRALGTSGESSGHQGTYDSSAPSVAEVPSEFQNEAIPV